MDKKARILGAYKDALGHVDKKSPVANGLMSQEERIYEQRMQAQGMSNKITELQAKKKITINTLDGRTLLT